ncbi:MOSC N-terminal beta barrel domain-containing protein [Armillaria mellea]|nr:MOSC N-terminal beta barrel domain-containing protein [Armillaria mellea]
MLDLFFDRLPLDRTTGTDTHLTFLVGAAVLFLVLYRSIPLSLLISKATMQRPPALTVSVQGREMTIDPSRLHKPNFGYDVTVSKLLIHPIKSCRGLSVTNARYTPEGLENDRLWSIVDAVTKSVITAREVSKMVLITPQIETDDNSPYGGVLRVSFPEDSSCNSFDVPLHPSEEMLNTWQSFDVVMWGSSIDSYVCEAVSLSSGPSKCPSAILSSYFEKPVHLVFKGRRPRNCAPTAAFPELKATAVYQDGYPLLVLSEESMNVLEDELRNQVGKQGVDEHWRTDRLMIERFRPNIVFKGAGPFAEDMWEEIAIESGPVLDAPGILIVSKCVRCLLPNVSPDTGVRDKAVPYKVLMKVRTGIDPANKMKPCVGCNGVPLGEGVIRLGDKVVIRRMVESIENDADTNSS